MKRDTLYIPTPPEIAQHPELAVLFLLAESLHVALRTILAAHPVLLCEERPCWISLSPDEKAAERLLAAIGRLSKSLLRYQSTIPTGSLMCDSSNQSPPEEPPF